MRLLLDTNALLAVLRDVAPLPIAAEWALNDPANEKVVSVVNFWELTIKVSLRKLIMREPPEAVLEKFEQRRIATILSIRADHLRVLRTLPLHHRDPFDRLLVAQALAEDCTLVSSDVALDAYGVPRLW